MTRFSGTLRGEPVEIEARDYGVVELPEGEFYHSEFTIAPYEPHIVLVQRRIVEKYGAERRAHEERAALREQGVELESELA